jgi:uncharacterized cupin superfamily protein
MDVTPLVRLVWKRFYDSNPARGAGAAHAIRRIASCLSASTASKLLDAFPEADGHGMQVYTPCAEQLRSLGPADGAGSQTSPMTYSRRHFETIDGVLATGEWDSGPGRHVIKFHFDEWVHVLEGEAQVTVQGRTRTIKAGDVALFRAGLDMTWDVPKYIRKVWVHRYPRQTLVGRTVSFIERRL